MGKRLVLAAMMVFLFVTCIEAQPFSEGKFTAIFARSSLTFSDLDLNQFGLGRDTILKEIGFSTILDRNYRLKYAAILPDSQTGTGLLLKPLIVDKVVFGPRDDKDTQKVTLDTRFLIHRFEIELLDRMPLYFQPKLFGEYLMSSVKITGKPQDTKLGEVIEAKDSFNKLFIGIGATGYQRNREFMAKYEVAYTFADSGWFVDLFGRYDARAMFVDMGLRYEKKTAGNYRVEFIGPYASLGWKF